MTKLAIFGDSFVDPTWKNRAVYPWTWVNRLAKDYPTHNAGLMGTGPDYALEHLLQYIEQTHKPELSETCCVFVCSDPHRLNLKDFWEEDKHQVNLIHIADRSQPHPKHMFARDLIRHLMVPEWRSREDFKILCTLSALAGNFRRVLYWPAIDPYPIYVNMIHTPENMQVVLPGFFDISSRTSPTGAGYDDSRVNHFDPDQHGDIYDAVSQWIATGKPVRSDLLLDRWVASNS